MRSALPKVLHPVAGDPMAAHVIDAARSLAPARIAVVVGHEAARVREALAAPGVTFVDQPEQLGTADAVARCEEALAGCDRVVVLNGDTPLISPELLASLLAACEGVPLALVTADVADAGRLGRVRRDERNALAAVVEAVDDGNRTGACEINGGQYCFEAAWLWANLARVPLSPKGERYLTILPAYAHEQGTPAGTVSASEAEILGVDDRAALARAEASMRERLIRRHQEAGVTFVDPATVYLHRGAELEPDVTVLPNCYLYGSTFVATDAVIGPGTTLRDARVGAGSSVQHSVIEESTIGERTVVGPFAHVRGGAAIGDDCEIHNYAEIKNSAVGRGVKMHHFSYLGDADVGDGANIGAGTVTVNFDGVAKHRTTIGQGAFVGCDTMLIAPVVVGERAFTAAGSVVTRDVAEGVRVAGVPARELKPKSEGGS